MSNVTAIIIARGGSTRLPHKNLLKFNQIPLVAHKVLQLKRCHNVDRIVVGSDSPEILDVAKRAGADTRVRAPEYCDEISRSWNEVIVDMALRVPGEVILWAHCTNPCIRPSTYDRAIARYNQVVGERTGDSLVSVTPVARHAWYKNRPVNYNPYVYPHPVAAQLEPIYFQDGGIFIYDRVHMIRNKYVFGIAPVLMGLDDAESIDIDTREDFQRAEAAFDWTLP